jgi:hypothetical protein
MDKSLGDSVYNSAYDVVSTTTLLDVAVAITDNL